MLGMGCGSRSRGCPRRQWLDVGVDVTGLSLEHLKEEARTYIGTQILKQGASLIEVV